MRRRVERAPIVERQRVGDAALRRRVERAPIVERQRVGDAALRRRVERAPIVGRRRVGDAAMRRRVERAPIVERQRVGGEADEEPEYPKLRLVLSWTEAQGGAQCPSPSLPERPRAWAWHWSG